MDKGGAKMDFLWFLHDLRSPVLTVIFQFFTLFGEEVIIVGILCSLYWCYDKELAFGAAISFFVAALLVQGLKIAVRIDRPWILDPTFTPVASAMKTATGFSFPSGHTQSAASLFGYLGLSARKKGWRFLSFGLMLMVALSRLYLGVHTPWDVLASLAIALGIALFVQWYLRSGRSELVLPSALLVLSVIVIIYAFVLHGQGLIDTHYLSDCCKAAGGCIGCAISFYAARKFIPFQTKTPHLWQQIVKWLAGAAVILAIQSGLKALLGASLAVDILRYCLIAVWALALYPLLFSRLIPAAK